ncbi:zinc finger matrin-type protein [Phaffia rhodozyma]|uniref:Zinc finger matrin-type protein n=1 Tax=Phaffia rhodozyma TaxID=264483 RepID=A0A0F7SUP1_PHARH|nr:zinc finger matrin-type protein [Phaffia rhodozyma]
MAEKTGAYGKQENASGRDGKWDMEVFKERAKERDKEAFDKAKEHEEAALKGKKAPRTKPDLPKPTKLLEQRTHDLGIDNNLNKTMVVNNPGGRGAGQPGFYCDLCKRVSKDSIAYLSHVNGKTHLRRLGQTTQVARSTLDQVRAKIAFLRAQTSQESESKRFNFEKRLAEVTRLEDQRREAEKQKIRVEKEQKREKELKAKMGVQDEGIAGMMGFGGFGSRKIR